MNRVRQVMATRVTTNTRICMYETSTSSAPPGPNEKLPGIRLGMDLSLESCDSRTVFCRKIDMPMAEISGISRLLLRSGR